MKKFTILCFLMTVVNGLLVGQSISPNGYYVSGNRVYDQLGNEVYFKGVNRPSLEWNSKGQKLVQKDIQAIASSCANIVRLPLNQDFWLKNTDNYRATVDSVIKWCMQENLNVILDLHWSQKNDPNLPAAQQNQADEISLNFWYQMATKYKDNGKLLFELYNEPNNITWDQVVNGGINDNGTSSDPSDDWTMAGYQQMYDTVRAAGAENLVIIGGLNWTFDLTYYETNPIKGFNIMYATHCYPFSNKLSDNWYKWSRLASTQPVFATEFGPKAYTNTDYIQEVVDTLAKLHGHYTAWAWWGFSNGENSMWNSFDPANGIYDSTFYGKWVFKELKKQCNPLITSVQNEETPGGFDFYPNPATNVITIQKPLADEVQVTVLNSMGRVVKQEFSSNDLTFQLDVSRLPEGVYFLKLKDQIKKMIIK